MTTGEPLYADEGAVQLQRTGRLAAYLAGRGMRVTWWTGRFDHRAKRQRRDLVDAEPNRVAIRLIDSPGYQRNVSIQRIFDHRVFASNFLRDALRAERPDVIVASLPTVDGAYASIKAGQFHRCPTVVDVRDQWPDLMVEYLPPLLRPFGRAGLHVMDRQARQALAQSTAIIGITEPYVAWALEKARRQRRPLDRAFPISREPASMANGQHTAGLRELAAAGIVADGSVATVSFVGTLGKQFDIASVIAAGAELRARHVPVRLVIAGDGEARDGYVRAADGLPNVVFPGEISRVGVGALLGLSIAGLAPYVDVRNFRDNVPNKIIEYLSAGLPILSPLSGEVASLIRTHEVGVSYAPGNAMALADAIERLRRETPLRRAMSENARRLFLDRYDADRVHASVAAYLDEVVSQFQ